MRLASEENEPRLASTLESLIPSLLDDFARKGIIANESVSPIPPQCIGVTVPTYLYCFLFRFILAKMDVPGEVS